MMTKSLSFLYPVVNETQKIKIADDMNSNGLTINYLYEVDGFWQDGDKGESDQTKGLWIFRFEPLFLYQYLPEFRPINNDCTYIAQLVNRFRA